MSAVTVTAKFTDTTPMPFGKFQGKTMANVPAVYLLWLYNKGCNHAGVRQYIMDNMDCLNKEAKNVRK